MAQESPPAFLLPFSSGTAGLLHLPYLEEAHMEAPRATPCRRKNSDPLREWESQEATQIQQQHKPMQGLKTGACGPSLGHNQQDTKPGLTCSTIALAIGYQI